MIKILRLDHQGRGIGLINNKIIFIDNTLPNEIVEYKITKEKKNYIEGQAIKIIKKSKIRIEPFCPYANICGGCQLQHLPYNEQLNFKQKKIEEIINKFTNKQIKILPIIKCDNIFEYRNKITLHSNETTGLYKKDSNEIINIKECKLVNKKINNIIQELNSIILNKDEIIIKNHNNETLLYYTNKNNNLKNIKADNIILNNETVKGKNYINESLNNFIFKISPQSFFQVNTKQTIKLYDTIKKVANINKNDIILDLYCGTGTIGIYLCNQAKKVLGIDINKDAINDAQINKQLNNIKNIEFIAGDAKNVIKKLKYKPSIIIIDPPRSGLHKEMINDLIKFNANKIIYVSCEPITLARDIKKLNEQYSIDLIQPVDMFPNTYHVESVVLLNLKTLEK